MYTTSLLATALENMARIATERHAKRRDILVDQFPHPEIFDCRVAIGSFSMTTPTERMIIKHAVTRPYTSDLPMVPPELARDYLDLTYPKRLRASGKQAESYHTERFAPLYYRPLVSRYAYYVDLQGAFWWLMSQIGWDVDYFPGVFLSPGRAPYDFPFANHKLARNCLVTCGLSNPITVWTGHRLISQNVYNVHLNLGLYSCIMDILHMFGIAAAHLGAKYVNTDGYIIDDKHLPELLGYLDRFHAPYTLKHQGETMVTGCGSYRIGDYATKHFRTTFDTPMSNLVRPPNHVMLDTDLRYICSDRLDRPGLFMI